MTSANRFLQDRIIDRVAYQVPGSRTRRRPSSRSPSRSFVRLDATTSRITVKILETSASGGLDYTAISEIYVYGYSQ